MIELIDVNNAGTWITPFPSPVSDSGEVTIFAPDLRGTITSSELVIESILPLDGTWNMDLTAAITVYPVPAGKRVIITNVEFIGIDVANPQISAFRAAGDTAGELGHQFSWTLRKNQLPVLPWVNRQHNNGGKFGLSGDADVVAPAGNRIERWMLGHSRVYIPFNAGEFMTISAFRNTDLRLAAGGPVLEHQIRVLGVLGDEHDFPIDLKQWFKQTHKFRVVA